MKEICMVNSFVKKWSQKLLQQQQFNPQQQVMDISQKRKLVKKPIFIIGCGRSGTTLLFQLLKYHPQLSPTQGYPDGEDHLNWIDYGNCKISGFGHPGREEGKTGFSECPHMDESDVTPEIIQRMTDYYYHEVLKEDPNQRVLTKVPHLSNKLRYVLEIFPDAKFIHIIRDCVPMVFSWKKVLDGVRANLMAYLPEKEYPCFSVLPKSELENVISQGIPQSRIYYQDSAPDMFVDYWIETNRNIPLQMDNDPLKFLTLKYEDLILDPLNQLNQLCDFCEIDLFKQMPALQIYPKQNDDYKRYFSDEQVASWQSRASSVQRYFGYTH
jgi:hypothetical protein